MNINNIKLPDDIDIISFDIFDTLILRPFYDPKDLFYLIENKIQDKINASDLYPFHDIRILSEELARKESKYEEITLDDIYNTCLKISSLPKEILDYSKELEISLEYDLCRARKSIYDIYKYYKSKNKTIICTSDMYLDESIISSILQKLSYQIDDIFVSSTYKKTKSSGSLYDIILNKFPSKKILHIGDNYNSDYIIAKKKGIQSIYINKTIDNFKKFKIKNEKDFFAGNLDSFLGVRCAYAMIANKFFDTICPKYNTSDFIGYSYLGMYLYAISYWIMKHAKEYDKLVFCARDGFIPMRATKIINNFFSRKIKIKYLMSSRSSILPFIFFDNNIDIALNIINYNKFSPRKILYYLHDFLLEKNFPYASNSNFKSNAELLIFLHKLKNFIDYDYLHNHIVNCKKYFDIFFLGKVAFFDIGYSLRTETILKNLYGYNINSFYVNINSDLALRRSNLYKIKSYQFYTYSPKNLGGLREALFSKEMGSCIGYKADKKNIKIKFDEYSFTNNNKELVNTQQAALKFVDDFCNTFKEHIHYMEIRNIDSSILFENFVNSNNKELFSVFKQCNFEDKFSSNENKMTLYTLSLIKSNDSKFKKLYIYALYDRKKLLSKVKEKIFTLVFSFKTKFFI